MKRAATGARLVRRASVALLLVVMCALVLASAASSQFGMRGAVEPEHWAWTWAAVQNVPLPSVTVRLRVGSPFYLNRVLWVPRAGEGGWTLQAEHGLFLHELGHAFDQADMTLALRGRFEAVAGTTCGWLQTPCDSLNRRSGQTIEISPAEMFAEEYMACALGLTRHQIDDAGYNTYGWDPPDGSDAALCDVIRAA